MTTDAEDIKQDIAELKTGFTEFRAFAEKLLARHDEALFARNGHSERLALMEHQCVTCLGRQRDEKRSRQSVMLATWAAILALASDLFIRHFGGK